jgi:hypothetical protein
MNGSRATGQLEHAMPVIVSPNLGNEPAGERFRQGQKELKPYLRIVELP